MSTETNKATARHWIEDGWNKHNVAIIDETYQPNVVQHDPNVPMPVNSAEDLKAYVSAYLAAFPDAHFKTEALIAEGDNVVWRFVAHAHQTGALMGFPPSGRSADIDGTVQFRFVNGKIAEVWVLINALGMAQAIGMIPAMA
jgi:steroid delta-isomerase-like uncharacterized protein